MGFSIESSNDLLSTLSDSDSFGFKGQIITPSSSLYASSLHRWASNARRPASLILYPTSTQDVSSALRWIQSIPLHQKLPIAVCGGGHSASGASSISEGIVIDLSKFVNDVRIDVEEKRAYVGGGARWKDVDEAAIVHGLAAVGGTVNDTGVGGLTLGGGFGFLTGEHGLVLDNLLEGTIVTADGSILTANDIENSDLFWGIRGGGGNFGIVTEFVYQLHPQQRNIFAGVLTFPGDKVRPIFTFIQEWWKSPSRSAREALVVFMASPPGMTKPILLLVLFYNGREEEGRRIYKPLYDLGPIMDSTRERPYEEVNTLQNKVAAAGRGIFMTATSLPPNSPDVPLIIYEHLLAHSDRYTRDDSGTEIRLMAMFEFFGLEKVNSIPKDATAFASRGTGCNIMIQGIFDGNGCESDLREKEEKARELASSLKKLVMESALGDAAPYGNYETEEKPPASRSRVVFKHNYPRLREIKAKYDPNQVFSRWFGIEPA